MYITFQKLKKLRQFERLSKRQCIWIELAVLQLFFKGRARSVHAAIHSIKIPSVITDIRIKVLKIENRYKVVHCRLCLQLKPSNATNSPFRSLEVIDIQLSKTQVFHCVMKEGNFKKAFQYKH